MIPLLVAFLLVAQDQPPERCSIAGTVVDSVTGRPLNKVQLRLERQPRDQDSGTITDAEGKFAMAGIEPGAYRLRASRNGYRDTFYGARSSGSGTTLSLTAGQEITGLIVKLQPFALISGTARDADGEPLVGVAVSAFRWMYIGSKRRLAPASYVRTDDLGQYRMAQMRPGRYLLRVDPESDADLVDRTAGGNNRREFNATTYYPNAAGWMAAAPVELAAGTRLVGVDVTVRRTRLFRVAGHVMVAPGVEDLTRDVSIRDVNDEPFVASSAGHFRLSPEGTFTFGRIAPGSYRVQAEIAGTRTWVGSSVVEVGNSDVDGVSIVIRPGTEVTARLVVEGQPIAPLENCVALFDSPENSFVGRPTGANNTFSVSLPPGRYTVHFSGNDDLFLKAASVGGSDVLAEGLTVGDSGRLQMELVLSADAGQVMGTAMDADDKPAAGATVVLAPEARLRGQTERFQWTAADQYGHFEFKGVPPGEYKVLAWDDIESGSWFDAEFLKKYERSAETVTVTAKQAATIKVRVAPPE